MPNYAITNWQGQGWWGRSYSATASAFVNELKRAGWNISDFILTPLGSTGEIAFKFTTKVQGTGSPEHISNLQRELAAYFALYLLGSYVESKGSYNTSTANITTPRPTATAPVVTNNNPVINSNDVQNMIAAAIKDRDQGSGQPVKKSSLSTEFDSLAAKVGVSVGVLALAAIAIGVVVLKR